MNPAMFRRSGRFSGAATRRRVWGRYGGRCEICGHAVTLEACELDHIVPLAEGGADEEYNLRPAHQFCNSSRRYAANRPHTLLARSLKEYRMSRGLSQAAFARLLGVSKRTYEKWENTEREPENAGPIWIALRCLQEHQR